MRERERERERTTAERQVLIVVVFGQRLGLPPPPKHESCIRFPIPFGRGGEKCVSKKRACNNGSQSSRELLLAKKKLHKWTWAVQLDKRRHFNQPLP
jgi:hypothetical protein